VPGQRRHGRQRRVPPQLDGVRRVPYGARDRADARGGDGAQTRPPSAVPAQGVGAPGRCRTHGLPWRGPAPRAGPAHRSRPQARWRCGSRRARRPGFARPPRSPSSRSACSRPCAAAAPPASALAPARPPGFPLSCRRCGRGLAPLRGAPAHPGRAARRLVTPHITAQRGPSGCDPPRGGVLSEMKEPCVGMPTLALAPCREHAPPAGPGGARPHRMCLSLVPPPVASRPRWCGDHASALTAAVCAVPRKTASAPPLPAPPPPAAHTATALSLPPLASCRSSGDHCAAARRPCLCPWVSITRAHTRCPAEHCPVSTPHGHCPP